MRRLKLILRKTLIAEIIGPAGSGKSSLSLLLRKADNVRTGLSVWRLPFTLLATSAFLSLPHLVVLCRRRRGRSWENLKLVIQHNALLRLISRESAKGYEALVLDEGTIFALAKLRAFATEVGATDSDDSDTRMNNLFDGQASLLNAVIWLDASDDVLARRIRERDKPHRVKNGSDAEIQNHLARYRDSFEQVVSELSKRNGLKVLKFSTDTVPLEEIAATVLSQARAGV